MSFLWVAKSGILALQRLKNCRLILHSAEGAGGGQWWDKVLWIFPTGTTHKSTGVILSQQQDCCEHIWAPWHRLEGGEEQDMGI